ncbi:hypothetical protein FA13DRAFT_172693 [Coprinellus micaceus]|uniref:Uncharacterized protein n=1 Tax=Coprinellus micaceus TaxID=71717 RepID=A0A4Y7SGF2_COPMI|nr:hypothetical protein FA13DRAFT_172693 [Coprinellus micaceus]
MLVSIFPCAALQVTHIIVPEPSAQHLDRDRYICVRYRSQRCLEMMNLRGRSTLSQNHQPVLRIASEVGSILPVAYQAFWSTALVAWALIDEPFLNPYIKRESKSKGKTLSMEQHESAGRGSPELESHFKIVERKPTRNVPQSCSRGAPNLMYCDPAPNLKEPGWKAPLPFSRAQSGRPQPVEGYWAVLQAYPSMQLCWEGRILALSDLPNQVEACIS